MFRPQKVLDYLKSTVNSGPSTVKFVVLSVNFLSKNQFQVLRLETVNCRHSKYAKLNLKILSIENVLRKSLRHMCT